jgi:hypothetical protein
MADDTHMHFKFSSYVVIISFTSPLSMATNSKHMHTSLLQVGIVIPILPNSPRAVLISLHKSRDPSFCPIQHAHFNAICVGMQLAIHASPRLLTFCAGAIPIVTSGGELVERFNLRLRSLFSEFLLLYLSLLLLRIFPDFELTVK